MARKKNKSRAKNGSIFTVLILAILVALDFASNGKIEQTTKGIFDNYTSQAEVAKNTESAPTHGIGGLSDKEYKNLANKNFKSGQSAYIEVNHDRSTLNRKAWKTNQVIYAHLDGLNRTSSSNTAFLERRNVANDNLRERQFVKPTGWHYNHRNGVQIYNRGHLIAYSISAGIDQDGKYNPNNKSGDQNNPKNLFTQTAFSNQKIQTIFEARVRKSLRENKKVIFQATPIFRGNELMARGINLQAISTDGSLNFNVYLFNIQPGFKFNYQSGRAQIDRQMKVKNYQ